MPVREVPRDVHGERARSDDQEDRGTDDRGGALHDRSILNSAANRADWASAGCERCDSPESGLSWATGIGRLPVYAKVSWSAGQRERQVLGKAIGSSKTRSRPSLCENALIA